MKNSLDKALLLNFKRFYYIALISTDSIKSFIIAQHRLNYKKTGCSQSENSLIKDKLRDYLVFNSPLKCKVPNLGLTCVFTCFESVGLLIPA